jgi:predicted nucleotidyltransferase
MDEEILAAFFRKHHICKLSFFGSVLRDDFGPTVKVVDPVVLKNTLELTRRKVQAELASKE